jgi:hypothetical protein
MKLAILQTRSASWGEKVLPLRISNPDYSEFQPLAIRSTHLPNPVLHIINSDEEELEFYLRLFMTNINSISEAWDFHGVAFFSVLQLTVYQTTRRYIPEYRNLNETIIFTFFEPLTSLLSIHCTRIWWDDCATES